MKLRQLQRRLLLQYLLTVGLLVLTAEVALYTLMRWAGRRELDNALRKEVDRIQALVELDRDRPRIDDREALDLVRLDGGVGAWQVLLPDGRTLGRSRGSPSEAGDLPALGDAPPPLDELRIGDAEYSGAGVRAARLQTVRQRKGKPPSRPAPMPEQMAFDIRVVLDRSGPDAQLGRLALCLAGGFPVFLGLTTVGGVHLIRRAVRPVEQAFERERSFTGAVSHELRTPLTALRGEIDVTLRRERPGAEYVEALGRMDSAVGQMTHLVEELLIVARARAGHLLLGATEVSAGALRAAVEEVVRLLPGCGRVTVACPAPEGTKVFGDGLLLALAVRNLVENALVHAPGGSVRVRIGADPAGGLRLTIEDEGPGIPGEVLASFLDKNSDPGLPAPGNGRAGFGLSIARAVVESHGGRLALENQPDAGCLAVISLPGLRSG